MVVNEDERRVLQLESHHDSSFVSTRVRHSSLHFASRNVEHINLSALLCYEENVQTKHISLSHKLELLTVSMCDQILHHGVLYPFSFIPIAAKQSS